MIEIHAFKRGSPLPIGMPEVEDEAARRAERARIRCPLCGWEPTARSQWACVSDGTPEPFSGGCGTIWNTFETGGRCPGCAHQWTWTSCLRCHGWSLHQDWYEITHGR